MPFATRYNGATFAAKNASDWADFFHEYENGRTVCVNRAGIVWNFDATFANGLNTKGVVAAPTLDQAQAIIQDMGSESCCGRITSFTAQVRENYNDPIWHSVKQSWFDAPV